jgi:crotonobetainyl-CoA:carnitine CoA-transferase CaiB-like acyl-CoA transferase
MTAAQQFVAGHAPAPLQGWTVARQGGSVAVDIAVGHLRALGCGLTESPPSETCAEGAGQLRLSPPDGERRPLVVECAIEWAGSVDMPLEDEITVQAACGIMHVHGRKSGIPEPLGVDYASVTAGVLAGQGALAALVGRLRGTDLGHVRTSVAQAALLSVMQYLAAATSVDDRADGWSEPMRPGGPPFTSADGVRFEIEVFDAAGWQRFWALVAADEIAVRRGWQPFQLRYATATCPLPDELQQAAGCCRFAALTAAAAVAGISILRLRDVAEGATDLPPWRLTAMPGRTPAQPLPRPPTTAQLPLEGLVVVEACRRLQGPLAGHILGLLGARVVRIEPPGGDLLRGMPPMAGDVSARFLALNRGKDVVEIDLKSSAGRRSVRELVAQADVFVHNWAPGKAAQLELDAGHLAAVRPGLVYAYASGWADALGARPPLGTDFMVQAYSGLAAMIRPYDEPPAPSLMTLTDVLGGLICAQGVLAGLLARIRSGSGQRVDSSLLSAAAVLQQPVLNMVAAAGDAGPRARRPVWTPLHRPLATADGYVALSTRTRMVPERVAAVCGAGSSFEAIVARFRQEPSQTWIERLSDADLVCVPVCTSLAALATDPRFALALQHHICTFTCPPWEFS